ncbi:hypothetical protein CCP3SC15_150022 [Gammaproteobacteria bacterium]
MSMPMSSINGIQSPRRYTWVAAAVGVAGVGASLYSSSQAKKGGGSLQVQKPEWMTRPGMGEATNMLGADTADRMRRMRAGQAPSWLENAMPTMRRQAMDPLRENYWGGGGSAGPGMIQRSMEAASIGGAGPKAVTAAARKSMYDYNQQSKQIDDQMSMMRYNSIAQEAQTLPTFISGQTQMSNGGTPYNVPGSPAPTALNWGDLASGVQSWNQNRTKQNTQMPSGWGVNQPVNSSAVSAYGGGARRYSAPNF